MATDHSIDILRTKIPINMLRENRSVNIQRIIFSHHDWLGDRPDMSQSLNQIVK